MAILCMVIRYHDMFYMENVSISSNMAEKWRVGGRGGREHNLKKNKKLQFATTHNPAIFIQAFGYHLEQSSYTFAVVFIIFMVYPLFSPLTHKMG